MSNAGWRNCTRTHPELSLILVLQGMLELFEIRSPIVLDGLDETIHLRYGNMPNAVYVVNKEGNIIYKANWTDSPVVDQVLEQLSAEEKARDPGESEKAALTS